jgi:pyruvate dehydrogenase E2 component (dihydrolipoamide acetyltransferase)
MDLDAGTATYHRYVNLGMAVDTERGLLVPNIKDAQDLTIAALARRIADLAARTRGKKITPDEISGGTFTITNTGSLGTLFDTPILNAPEAAILATAAIEKRPVVVSDAYGDSIAIRWMSYLCLTYDHRILDGADAARFLQDLKWVIEQHDWVGELGM